MCLSAKEPLRQIAGRVELVRSADDTSDDCSGRMNTDAVEEGITKRFAALANDGVNLAVLVALMSD